MNNIISIAKEIMVKRSIDCFYFSDKDFSFMEDDELFCIITYMSIYVKNFNNSFSQNDLDLNLSKIRNDIIHYYERFDIDKIRQLLVNILSIFDDINY